jgi:hypothetical protein
MVSTETENCITEREVKRAVSLRIRPHPQICRLLPPPSRIPEVVLLRKLTMIQFPTSLLTTWQGDVCIPTLLGVLFSDLTTLQASRPQIFERQHD